MNDRKQDNAASEFSSILGAPAQLRKRVFLSHATEDAGVVQELCAGLERRGIGCWVAPRDIPAGRSWAQCIVEAIDTCPFLVLFLTPSANESNHIISEVERAHDRGRTLITLKTPSVIPNPALEYLLSKNQWISAEDLLTAANIEEVVKTVTENEELEASRAMTMRPAQRATEPARPAPVQGRLTVQLNGPSGVLSGKTRHRLADGQKLILGRSMDVDVWVRDDLASRRHACLTATQEGDGLALWILDMQSSNGTQVNGQPVAGSRRLADGDTIRIGTTDIGVVVR
jgi:hypothetical protein